MTDTTTNTPLAGRTIAFLVAEEGIEEIELTSPWEAVLAAGARPRLLSVTDDTVQAFDHLTASNAYEVDHHVAAVSPADVDGLVLPGGVANPDQLRMSEDAVDFVRRVVEDGTPVAAICHAPWMLVEADAVRGRTLTSWPSLETDLRNAGATWVDEEVHVDHGGSGVLVTSRSPDDLEAFNAAAVKAFAA